MKPQTLVSILLLAVVFGGECRFHGEEDFRSGEERLHEVEINLQKRAVYKKGDHLFNNIAKAFTKMIQDIFQETSIHRFCRTRPGDQFIVEDTTDKNKDVTSQFQFMAQAFQQYKTDKLLTTDRDSLSVYGQPHEGPDENALRWSANIEELRRRVFALINKFIEVQIQGQPRPKETLALQNQLRDQIDQIINRREYVDQDAKNLFIQKKENKGKLELVRQVEQRSEAVLRELPAEANKWAVEAANFVKKKFSGKN